MLKRLSTLFLSPRGRINRVWFLIALVVWLVFYALQSFWFSRTGFNQFNSIFALALLFLNLHIIFCIYGKRLHDFGRSTWPLFGMFALVLMSAIFVMLNFGGLEYFETLNQNPEIVQDPDAMKRVQETYQKGLAENLPQSRLIMSIIPLLFTLWVALRPGDSEANKYGDIA